MSVTCPSGQGMTVWKEFLQYVFCTHKVRFSIIPLAHLCLGPCRIKDAACNLYVVFPKLALFHQCRLLEGRQRAWIIFPLVKKRSTQVVVDGSHKGMVFAQLLEKKFFA